MNLSLIRKWLVICFSFTVIALVIRAVWQIATFPTAQTMLIFIPLIIALLGVDALLIYLAARPDKLRRPAILIGMMIALTAGLIAGVTHFVRFFISPLADPPLSKIISSLILISSLGIYVLFLYIARLLWKKGKG